MTKIMVVEDDQSLREIYSIRLTAEGYEIVSAGDGEEALAMAVKDRPDLILSDVMMPKISGFDMLDILRSTPETKDIKVIMMTALSSDDQRKRGEGLGADRYLVKSQVGIEDVITAVKEVLAGGGKTAAPTPDAPATPAAPAPTPAAPEAPAPAPAAPEVPVTQPVPASAPAAPEAPAVEPAPAAEPAPAPAPATPVAPVSIAPVQGEPNAQPTPQPAEPAASAEPPSPVAPAQ